MRPSPYDEDSTLYEHWCFGWGDAMDPGTVTRPVPMSSDPAERLAYRQGAKEGFRAELAEARRG